MADLQAKSELQGRGDRKEIKSLLKGLVVALWASSLLSIVAVLWLGTPPKTLPSLGDMATLLFGASSLALILFSLLLGGLAIIGYDHLKKDIRDDVQKATNQRIDSLEKELRGSVVSSIGLMMGIIHEQREHEDYLAEAVLHCQQGYKMLQDVEGNARYTTLNNLVYYSCLLGANERGDYLLENARILKAMGQKLNFAEYLLTYCRAVLQFSVDHGDLKDAHSVATAVLLRKDLTDRQRKEATSYVALLTKKLPNQSMATKKN